ncbi:MAG: CDP-archaeol synthase [Candidatus Komeilibacteria bacterium]
MAPVFAQRLNFYPHLNKPIDGGAKLWGDFILGSGKTWRGLFVGVLMGMIIGGLEGVFYDLNWVTSLSPLPLSSLSGLLFGFLSGLGAILGDSVKSFFKRRVGIRSGNSWPVFDQIDFVIGASLLITLIIPWDWTRFITAIILTLILAPLSNWIGFHLTIKKVWW